MLSLNLDSRAGSGAFLVSILITLLPPVAIATAGQGASNPAGIMGQITDGTGAALPGVTVTATSPALQVPSVTDVTDVQGEYRLSPLPIGIYTVTYELAGFQNLRREGVQLTVGFVAKLDQVLGLGALTETVTVSGASPLVDVTNTATRTELTREQLDILPTSRDGLKSFMGQVPGIRSNLEVGSSSLTDGVVYRVYGQSGEPWQMLEGVLASSPDAGGGGGSHMEFNSIEGTRVQTIGSNAEMPRRGLLVDAVLKSGGNEFHGNATIYGSSGALESNNVDDELRAADVRGAQQLHKLVDFNANLGGRIIRNKLWFYAGYRWVGYDREQLDAFYEDGSPILLNTWMPYHLEKLSYQATPGNRFTNFYHVAADHQRRGASRFVPAESRELAVGPVTLAKAEWQGVRGNSLLASLQSGLYHYDYEYKGMETGSRVSTIDIATLQQSGDALTDGRYRQYKRYHSKGVVSRYEADLFGGNHDFKSGFDQINSWVSDADRVRPVAGDYQLVFNNGVPFQINTRNTPVFPDNKSTYLGVYYENPTSIAGRSFAGTMLINDRAADQTFRTIEVAAIRRLARGWQFAASYSATKTHIPFTCSDGTNPNGLTRGCAVNPNAEINATNDTWEWSGKISGAYTFPYGVTASANYDHRSGVPQARQVLFTGGQTIRSVLMNVEPTGTIRLPSTNLIDIRTAKRFPLGRGQALEARVDVFNVLNTNTVIRRVLQSGSSYLLPFTAGSNATTSIVLPRIVQVGGVVHVLRGCELSSIAFRLKPEATLA
jgi:hypothetical protein